MTIVEVIIAAVTKWHISNGSLAIGIFLVGMVSTLHILGVQGYLPRVDRYVTVGDIVSHEQFSELQVEVKELKGSVEKTNEEVISLHGRMDDKDLYDLRESIRDNRRRQCIALSTDQPTRAYEEQIDEDRARYRALSGVDYEIRPCEEYVRRQ